MTTNKALTEHVLAFRTKIDECDENFDLGLFYKISRLLVTETGEELVGNLTHLRSRYNAFSVKTRVSNIISEYFNWYFDFITCLRELNETFVTTVYNPLIEFYRKLTPRSSNGDKDDLSTSRLSIFSLGELFEGSETSSNIRSSDKITSGEYKNIKNLYDYADTENVSDRLKYILERLALMVEDEEDIDEKLFAQDSLIRIEALDRVKDDQISTNLLRFVPDILAKLKNAGRLAYRWLRAEDSRMTLAKEKLKTITAIEDELVGKITSLQRKITNEEDELMMKREELRDISHIREQSTNLAMSLYDIDKRIQIGETFLESLRNDQASVKSRYSTMKEGNSKPDKDELRAMKISYEKNKLRILNWEHDLSRLKFQRTMTIEDFHLKLEVDPDIMDFQTTLREKLVSLEAALNSDKAERNAIESALTPIIIEKQTFQQELAKQNHIDDNDRLFKNP